MTEGKVPTGPIGLHIDLGGKGKYRFARGGRDERDRSNPYKLCDLQDGTMHKILDQLDRLVRTPQVEDKIREVVHEMQRRGIGDTKAMSDKALSDALGI